MAGFARGDRCLHPPRSVAPGAGPGARRTRAQYDRIALNGPFDPWRLEREIGVAACHLAVRVACGTIGGGIGEAAFLRRPTREIGAMIDRVHGALLLPKCASTRNLGAAAAIYTRSRANRPRPPWGKMSTGILPPAAVGEPV